MTLKQALKWGMNKFNGKPCAKCGETLRYILGRNCVGCMKRRYQEGKKEIFK